MWVDGCGAQRASPALGKVCGVMAFITRSGLQSVSRFYFHSSGHLELVRTCCPLQGAGNPVPMSVEGKEKEGGRIIKRNRH